MPREFIADESFERDMGGLRGEKLRVLQTPHGRVLAFLNKYRKKDKTFQDTVVVGVSLREEYAGERITKAYVEPLPQDSKVRGDVSEILKIEGYSEPINFW